MQFLTEPLYTPSPCDEDEESSEYEVPHVAADVVEGAEGQPVGEPERMAAQTVVVAKILVTTQRQELGGKKGEEKVQLISNISEM